MNQPLEALKAAIHAEFMVGARTWQERDRNIIAAAQAYADERLRVMRDFVIDRLDNGGIDDFTSRRLMDEFLTNKDKA